jgi:antitoxin MazE
MQVKVKKWGNSASVRLPTAVMQAAHLSLEQIVDVREEDGRIIIEPIEADLSLNDLLDRITPDNCHGEIDTGRPVGAEIW